MVDLMVVKKAAYLVGRKGIVWVDRKASKWVE